jgi:hypothetical protein
MVTRFYPWHVLHDGRLMLDPGVAPKIGEPAAPDLHGYEGSASSSWHSEGNESCMLTFEPVHLDDEGRMRCAYHIDIPC